MNRSRLATATLGVVLVVAFGAARPRAVAAQGEVAQVQMVPDTLILRVAERALLSVQPRDRYGSVIPGQRVGWLSRDTTVATVDGRGYVTAIAPGVAVVAALVRGREGRAVVIVRRAPPGAGAAPGGGAPPVDRH